MVKFSHRVDLDFLSFIEGLDGKIIRNATLAQY